MNSELIMKSDVLDIIFEKRNKAYGAYMLRKFYNNRLIKSLAIMMLSVIVFSAFTFLPEGIKPLEYIILDPGFRKISTAPKVAESKPKLIKPSHIKPLRSLKLLSKIIIVNKKDSTDILQNLNDLMISNNTTVMVNDPGMTSVVLSKGNNDFNEPAKIIEPVVDQLKPMEYPEFMPGYPGGMPALRKFLERNLSTPGNLEPGELISVKVKFVVGYDGKLQRFELIQDGGNEFNNEVIRVLKKMPAWIPGKSKGENVSVYYTIPVKFIGEG